MSKLKLVNLLDRKIQVLDVGARGGLIGWLKEIENFCDVYSSEADPNLGEYKFNGFFNNNLKKNFYLCKENSQSSFFAPNPEINNFEDQESRLNFKIIKDLNTITIDSLNIENDIDIIKIDTQGSEYEILEGAKNLLKKCMPLIFLETWTYPFYKDIKKTSEIIIYLENYGYELWGMDEAASFRLKIDDLKSKNYSRRRIAGYNIFMVPNVKNLKNNLSYEKLKIYSFILYLHGYTDWSYELIKNNKKDIFYNELLGQIIKANKYAKINYLIYIFKDLFHKLCGKGSKPRYKKFT